jgi:hypothetical protein
MGSLSWRDSARQSLRVHPGTILAFARSLGLNALARSLALQVLAAELTSLALEKAASQVSERSRVHPFNTVCLPLRHSGDPGAQWRI